MNPPWRAAVALLAVLALTATGTGCGRGLSPSTSAASKAEPSTVTFTALPSVNGVIVDRDWALARAQLKAILLTARPAEHVILWDADTGRRLGSFTTPSGLTMRGPTPPPALPSDPTQVQCDTYRKEIAQYQATLQADLAKLHRRWLAELLAWATRVVGAIAAETGHPQIPEARAFRHALSTATADITSLERIPGANLGTRKVLVILGLDGVPTRAVPQLPAGLQGISVVVTGFTGTSGQETIWRAAFVHAGARGAVLLTPSTSQELPLAVEPVLNGGNQPSTLRQAGGC